MKSFLKKFPLTSYATAVVFIIFFLIEDKPRDEILPIDPLFWIIILTLPLIAVGQIYALLGLEVSLPFSILFLFLLDLLLLSLRTGSIKNFFKKTYHKFTKPKK